MVSKKSKELMIQIVSIIHISPETINIISISYKEKRNLNTKNNIKNYMIIVVAT
jgi:hypothetical protein